MSEQPVPAELQELREQIDRLDQSLVLLLANRFALTRRVGRIKAHNGLESFDAGREQCKLDAITALCKEHHVSPELMDRILRDIMREVVKNHEAIRAGTGDA
ncbi:MAG: chorismate mutase [Pseudohongiellaceae bacterium]